MRRILFSLLVLSALGPVAAHGESNVAYVDQIGSHNHMTVNQYGSQHYAKTYQQGDHNKMTVNQDGLGHGVDAYQKGDHNEIKVDQSGNPYRAVISQNGDHNFVNYKQANGNANISQHGQGHKAIVVDTRNRPAGAPPITVTQSGYGADVRVVTTATR
jgi:hypothetical protein